MTASSVLLNAHLMIPSLPASEMEEKGKSKKDLEDFKS